MLNVEVDFVRNLGTLLSRHVLGEEDEGEGGDQQDADSKSLEVGHCVDLLLNTRKCTEATVVKSNELQGTSSYANAEGRCGVKETARDFQICNRFRDSDWTSIHRGQLSHRSPSVFTMVWHSQTIAHP